MKILSLLSKEWGDARSKRELHALADAGHSVVVLARNRKNEPREVREGELVVRRLPSFARLGSKVSHIATLPLTHNPMWRRAILGELRRDSFDVIHVHDLPLVEAAVQLARPFGCRVVFDLHENYPAMMSVVKRGRLLAFANGKGWFDRLERRVLGDVDDFIVVCEEQKNRLVGLGVSAQSIHIVGNTIDVDAFDSVLQSAKGLAPLREGGIGVLDQCTPHVVYSGILGRNRGIEWLIRALAKVQNRGVGIRATLIGDGPMLPELKRMVMEEGLDPQIWFTGWVDYRRALVTMSQADIGVIPHLRDPHIDTTYPNKLFEFMALSRPLIVSDSPPLKRIVVDETGSGLAARSGDVDSLAEALEELAENPSRRVLLGRAGRTAVMGEYSFRTDQERLLSLYGGARGGQKRKAPNSEPLLQVVRS